MRVAAIQLQPVLADLDANLEASEKLVEGAVRDGAEWIALPEFFTTGMGFEPEMAGCALPVDGKATRLLMSLARRHGVNVGGSFLCADEDGEVRNAFILATPEGIAGRHDKDIPSMWENCYYVGGNDDGIIEAGHRRVGAALCFEFNRYNTVRRLRGKVDFVIGGSCTWGAPKGFPGANRLQREIERYTHWGPLFAQLMGCAVIDGRMCGRLKCRMQLSSRPYITRLGGGASICDAKGNVLATRHRDEGPGAAIADIRPGSLPAHDAIPNKYWISPLDAVSAIAWRLQRWHGKRWYRRHMKPRYQHPTDASARGAERR